LKKTSPKPNSTRGFSLIELLIVVAIMMVILSFSVMNLRKAMLSFKAASDARGIASQLSLAHMRAASEFTQARVNFNLSAGT
jgi:prepilin-type N-terminal cleavage/methylation domain-containing protein